MPFYNQGAEVDTILFVDIWYYMLASVGPIWCCLILYSYVCLHLTLKLVAYPTILHHSFTFLHDSHLPLGSTLFLRYQVRWILNVSCSLQKKSASHWLTIVSAGNFWNHFLSDSSNLFSREVTWGISSGLPQLQIYPRFRHNLISYIPYFIFPNSFKSYGTTQ